MFSKPRKTIRVGNIDDKESWDAIIALFTDHGLKPEPQGSLCRDSNGSRVATVSFRSEAEAKKALLLNGKILSAKKIDIDHDFFGLTVLASPENPMLDLIAIHGLNGHAFTTWVDQSAENDSMWLRDILPEALYSSATAGNQNNIRILTYGYNSTLIGSNTSVSTVRDFAKELLQRLMDDRWRDQRTKRPIIFVCHSLGGIVLKQALLLAQQYRDHYLHFLQSTQAILFLGTPHRGSRLADYGSLISHIATLSLQSSAKQLLQTLKQNSIELAQLSSEFRKIASSFQIVSFYERRKKAGQLVVDERSATLDIRDELTLPLDATHSDMCKFTGRSDPLFTTVLAQINRFREKICEGVTARSQAGITSENDTKSQQSSAFFLGPPGRNPYFQGRCNELSELKAFLEVDEVPQHPRTPPIIAVYGLGGVGKTQLLTEYVYQLRDDNPTVSVFWVSTASVETMHSDYGKIGAEMAAATKDREKTKPIATKLADEDRPRKPLTGAEYLLNWMKSRENGNWVLVLDNFDNVQLDKEFLIPNSGCGCIIVTSRDRRIIGSWAQSGIELKGLEFTEGERLLVGRSQDYRLATIQNPAQHPEYSAIQHIVRELHGFPLAIDQAGAFIRESSPMTFHEYVEYLKPRSEDRELLLRFKEALPKYPESVMTTWEISMRFLEANYKEASLLLTLLGFFHHSDIPESMLQGVTSTTRFKFMSLSVRQKLHEDERNRLKYLHRGAAFRRSVSILLALSLVTARLDRHSQLTLNVHPLVHEWIRLRLNSPPNHQAALVQDSALVLYQAFPFEALAEKLKISYSVISGHMAKCLSRLRPHTNALLLNLREYQDANIANPQETTSLLTAMTLTWEINARLLKDLFHESTKTGESGLRSLRQILGYMSVRLQACKTQSEWLQSAMEISNRLRSENSKQILSNKDAIFLIVFVSAILKFVVSFSENFTMQSRIQNRWTDRQPDLGAVADKSTGAPADDLMRSKLVHDILVGLRNTIALDLFSPFDRALKLSFEYRCVKLLTVGEYWQQGDYFLTSEISYHDLTVLDPDYRGSYLSFCAELQRNRPGLKDFAQTKEIYNLILKHAHSTLSERYERLQDEKQTAEKQRQSLHNSISSCEGRYGNTFAPSYNVLVGFEALAPLQFFWGSILQVVEEIADPSVWWIDSTNSQQAMISLPLSERRHGLYILEKVVRLFDLIEIESYDSFQYLEPQDVMLSLARVFEHLEEYNYAARLIHTALGFRKLKSLGGKDAAEDMLRSVSSGESVISLHRALASSRDGFTPRQGIDDISVSSEATGSIESTDGSLHVSSGPEAEWRSQIHRWSVRLVEQYETIRTRKATIIAYSGKKDEVVTERYTDNPRGGTLYILNELGIDQQFGCIVDAKTDDLIKTFVNCSSKVGNITTEAADRVNKRLALAREFPDPLFRALVRLMLIGELAGEYKGTFSKDLLLLPLSHPDGCGLVSNPGDHGSWRVRHEEHQLKPAQGVIRNLQIIHECLASRFPGCQDGEASHEKDNEDGSGGQDGHNWDAEQQDSRDDDAAFFFDGFEE